MKALVTFGNGPATELLEIARPSFEAFAHAHGYNLRVYDPDPDPFWPFPWLKVACIQDALKDYDEVLWVDSDIVITDPSEDLPVPDEAWQAMAVHHTQDGQVPNTGVWLCRRAMKRWLASLWEMHDYRNHPWWEQGALLAAMGYNSWARPIALTEPTELFTRTHFLTTEWNSHPWDEAEHPRFRHATMHDDRAAVMREWACLA